MRWWFRGRWGNCTRLYHLNLLQRLQEQGSIKTGVLRTGIVFTCSPLPIPAFPSMLSRLHRRVLEPVIILSSCTFLFLVTTLTSPTLHPHLLHLHALCFLLPHLVPIPVPKSTTPSPPASQPLPKMGLVIDSGLRRLIWRRGRKFSGRARSGHSRTLGSACACWGVGGNMVPPEGVSGDTTTTATSVDPSQEVGRKKEDAEGQQERDVRDEDGKGWSRSRSRTGPRGIKNPILLLSLSPPPSSHRCFMPPSSSYSLSSSERHIHDLTDVDADDVFMDYSPSRSLSHHHHHHHHHPKHQNRPDSPFNPFNLDHYADADA
ncbi:hypothetical protein D9758_016361 [Tetrapyrgos nigripes]|uniref:Uncharacterized protein n=1 Tax=Tetrapyrgos nigripes TaxID=182062 RepID=A0A8H5CCY0_9AGAR|nr:hypothetical protein D9758_016361 [Tetrapyrgos nigripes]